MKSDRCLASCLVVLLVILANSVLAAEAPVVPPREGKSETIKLFNGKNLDGWEGSDKYWSVVDGVIVGKNTEPLIASTYLLTKSQFHRLSLGGHRQTRDVGNAFGHRHVGQDHS